MHFRKQLVLSISEMHVSEFSKLVKVATLEFIIATTKNANLSSFFPTCLTHSKAYRSIWKPQEVYFLIFDGGHFEFNQGYQGRFQKSGNIHFHGQWDVVFLKI